LGEFSVHPKTKVITQISGGSSILDVDSTVGFPDTGELSVTYSDGTTGILTYRSKSVNQFFGVGVANTSTIGISNGYTINPESDLRLNVYAYGYVGVGTTTKVEMRIGSVLSEPIIFGDTYYYSKNDTARIKSLGIRTSSPKTDGWLYNISTKFDVKNVSISDASVPSYRVTTYSKNDFRVGDSISITDSTFTTNNTTIVGIIDEYSFIISGQGTLNGSSFVVQRNILKPKVDSTLSQYSYIENYFVKCSEYLC